MTMLDLPARPPLQAVGRPPPAFGEAPPGRRRPLVTVEALDPTAFIDLLWQAAQLGLPLSVRHRGPDRAWTAHGPVQIAAIQGGRLHLQVGRQTWHLEEAAWHECHRWRTAHRLGLRSGVWARAPGDGAVCIVQDMLSSPAHAVGIERCAWRQLLGRLVEDSRIDAGAARQPASSAWTIHA